jgi:hypothetical protein
MHIVTHVDTLTACRELGSLMDKARYRNEYTVNKSVGKPVAARMRGE